MSGTQTKHYQGTAGQSYHYSKRGIPTEAYDWVSRSRAEKIQQFVQATDVVYELGVGSGWNLAKLQCRRKLGLDVSHFLMDSLTSKGIEFFTESTQVPLAEVNVTICHHVLEHVTDPFETLQHLRKGMRPGSRLLVYVPFEVEGRYKRFNPEEPNHHLFSWNVQTLGNLVTESGFKVEKAGLGRFGYDRFAAYWAVRLKAGENGFRVLRRTFQLILPIWEVRLVASRSKD